MTAISYEYNSAIQRVFVLAQDEARAFNHPYVGAEHIVLGMLKDSDGVAAQALVDRGVTFAAFRHRVGEAIGRGSSMVDGYIWPTPRTIKIVDLAVEEAELLDSGTQDSGHLLCALLADGGGLATRILCEMGVDLDLLSSRVDHIHRQRDTMPRKFASA